MPIEVRTALGVSKSSNKLKLIMNQKTKTASIERPVSFEELSSRAQGYLKKGVKPLQNPREFYENREPRV